MVATSTGSSMPFSDTVRRSLSIAFFAPAQRRVQAGEYLVREELSKLSADTREPTDRPTRRSESDPDELLTVGQVARELQVIPPTVRIWIQAGALRASRPGNGLQPGRHFRIRRTDPGRVRRRIAEPDCVALAGCFRRQSPSKKFPHRFRGCGVQCSLPMLLGDFEISRAPMQVTQYGVPEIGTG